MISTNKIRHSMSPKKERMIGEKVRVSAESMCHILAPFPRLPHWYRSTVPEAALSVCIGADCIWLASIEVDHAYRHQGIGTAIINHLKALANSLGLPLCLTPVGETPEWQLCLEAWYLSLGFAWKGELMVYRPRQPRPYMLHNALYGAAFSGLRSLLGRIGLKGLAAIALDAYEPSQPKL